MDRSKIKRIIIIFVFGLFLSSDSQAAPAIEEKGKSFAGILYGYINDIQPGFNMLTVKSIEKTDSRHTIHIDNSTEIYVNKKRKKASSLYLGDKVAVRYFGRGTTIIADAIYVVFGEFVPKDYVVKKRLAVIKKDAGEKGKEEGGHGAEAKKDAKPKGH